MNATLCDRLKVWQKLADSPDSSASRETVLREIVEEVLRSRCLCRPRPGSELSGVYQSLYDAAQSRLLDHLRTTLTHLNFSRVNLQDWTRENCDFAFREVLDDEQLQKLAIAARGENCSTPEHQQFALRELVEAIRLSGRLCRPHREKFLPQFYELLYDEAVNQTLIYICQKIDLYDPGRSQKFMTWVNFRLDKQLIEVRREFDSVSDNAIPNLADLDEMFAEEPRDEEVELGKAVRQCIEEDADGVFRATHLRNRPEITFQFLALATISGRTWADLSQDLGVKVPTLSSFFRRCCSRFADKFKDDFW